MGELSKLYPERLWVHFETLNSIPRPSKKEEKIIAEMMKFGESLGLETIKDEVGNVIIKKPATPGMEDRQGVVLQGHLDMVPQANSDSNHDFEKDPILSYVDGDWVTAKGTTLGADNGMAIAAAMAVLEDKNIAHGPVEALFTVDEEAGMTGANYLKPGILDGDILLNMDSEDEGELYVGCAGGIDANVSFKYNEEDVPAGMKAFKVNVSGLKGGHSGIDIPLGRGNSNKIMFRFLRCGTKNHGLRLAKAQGGDLRNAIPREANAVIVVPNDKVDGIKKCLVDYNAIVNAELKSAENPINITMEATDMPSKVMEANSQNNFIKSIYACPNGVIRMSNDMEGLVETSTNLAIVTVENGLAEAKCLLRSSVDSAKDDLCNMIESVFELAGAEVVFDGAYPGWKPNMDSKILKTMQDVYNNKWGKIPKIMAIHAGLECGILGAAYPHWDMISFGPTIRYPHSPDEKVNIETVGKFWDYLVETLKHIPKK
jgi:dipeptidase D